MSTNYQSTYERLCTHARQVAILNSTLSLLGWDERTKLPKAGGEYRAEQMSFLAGFIHKKLVAPEVGEWLAELVLSPTAARKTRLRPVIDADLVVLDDLFLSKRLPEGGAELLQSLIHQRYKLRRSLIVTSNRVIADWAPTSATTPPPPRCSTGSCIAVTCSSSRAAATGSKKPPRSLHANPNHDNNSHRPAHPRGNLTRPRVEEIQVTAGEANRGRHVK